MTLGIRPSPLNRHVLLTSVEVHEYMWDNREETGWTSGVCQRKVPARVYKSRAGLLSVGGGASPVMLSNECTFYPQDESLNMKKSVRLHIFHALLYNRQALSVFYLRLHKPASKRLGSRAVFVISNITGGAVSKSSLTSKTILVSTS